MKQLTDEEIFKNQDNTINQFKVLQYLKKNLDIELFKIILFDRDTIKVIDSKDKIGYFKYDEDTKKVLFIEDALKNNTLEI